MCCDWVRMQRFIEKVSSRRISSKEDCWWCRAPLSPLQSMGILILQYPCKSRRHKLFPFYCENQIQTTYLELSFLTFNWKNTHSTLCKLVGGEQFSILCPQPPPPNCPLPSFSRASMSPAWSRTAERRWDTPDARLDIWRGLPSRTCSSHIREDSYDPADLQNSWPSEGAFPGVFDVGAMYPGTAAPPSLWRTSHHLLP